MGDGQPPPTEEALSYLDGYRSEPLTGLVMDEDPLTECYVLLMSKGTCEQPGMQLAFPSGKEAPFSMSLIKTEDGATGDEVMKYLRLRVSFLGVDR